ncbi:MAG TPA: RDD family protein [Thermoplasmata archaeon]|nr:RDD family protein [Thermoplasmata archaeon]
MVDTVTLASDVLQNAVTLLVPGLVALFLFLFAWEEPALARRIGFGRTVVWLLLPLGLLAWQLGDVPLLDYRTDVLAVNVTGGLIPVVVSLYALVRITDRPTPVLGRFLLVVAVASAVATIAVSPLASPASVIQLAIFHGLAAVPVSGPALLVTGTFVAAAVVAFAAARFRAMEQGRIWSRAAILIGLTGLGIIGTYLTTQPNPNGISSGFPYFLTAPCAIGAVAVPLVRALPRSGWTVEAGLPVAYAATTFGTLLGADLLRQPPLYGLRSSTVFAIGGGGVGDLVFLSGLIALPIAYLVYRLARRGTPADADRPIAEPTPVAALRRARAAALEGRSSEAITGSASAVRSAVALLRRLAGLPPPSDPARPWGEIAVPPWVSADQTNLDALAERPTEERGDAQRAVVTARYLVHVALVLARARFATFGRRARAFSIDLGLFTAVGAVGWALFVAWANPSDPSTLTSPELFLVTTGAATFGFLYFVLAEWLWGSTVGKRITRIEVTDRRLARPGIVSSLVRNIPKLVPLYAVSVAAVLFGLFARYPTIAVSPTLAPGVAIGVGVAAVILVLGLGIPGLASLLAIGTGREAQRFGDFVAGTWVVRQSPAATVPRGAGVPSTRPAPTPYG